MTTATLTAFRYPDIPSLGHYSILDRLEAQGGWAAEFKHNGHRCVAELRACAFTYTSRHNKPLPVSVGIRAQFEWPLCRNFAGIVLDCEWMGRRGGQPESLTVLEIVGLGGMRFPNAPESTYAARRALLARILPREIACVESRTSGFLAMYEESRTMPGVEGLVLKRLDSRPIWSSRECAINPGWIKFKHTGGSSGDRQID